MKFKHAMFVMVMIFMSGINTQLTVVSGVDLAPVFVVLGLLVNWNVILTGLTQNNYDRGVVWFLLVIVFFCTLSVSWSLYWQKGLFEALKLLLVFLVAVGFSQHYTFKTYIGCLAISMTIISLASIVSIYFPGVGLDQNSEVRGVFQHKNGLGRSMGYGVIACFVMLFNTIGRVRIFFIFSFLFCLGTLLSSSSATSLVGSIGVVSVISMFYLVRSMRVRRFLVNASLIAMVVIPFLPLLTLSLSPVTNYVLELLGRDTERTTLMIRFSLWSDLWPDILDRLYLGYGILGYWDPEGNLVHVLGNRNLLWAISQAHNGYIELMIQYGLVGLFLILLLLLLMFKFVSKVSMLSSGIISWGFIAFYLFMNNSYSAQFSQLTLPWLVTSTVLLFLAKKEKTEASNRQSRRA